MRAMGRERKVMLRSNEKQRELLFSKGMSCFLDVIILSARWRWQEAGWGRG